VMARMAGDAVAPLVGRVDEVAMLREAVVHVASGECRVVVLQGEPGVGKTRLLDELTAMATANGFRLLTARADDFDRRVPLAPLRLAIEPHLRAEQSPRDEVTATRLLQLLNVGRGSLVEAS